MTWMERIATQDSREETREVFDEWLQMWADTHDEVEFVGRTADVGVLHIRAGEPSTPNVDNHTARDLCANFATGRDPVRCIDITGVEEGVVQVNMLLASLRVHDPREEGGGWGVESDEHKQGQRDALTALLSSVSLDERTKSEIRHVAYEDRSIPKAVVDAAIEEADDAN